MVRIAHLADVHIGMENYGKLNPETGLNTRLDDFLRSLDQVLDEALAARVDLVAFAGDIYKTRDPTPTHQREFAKRIQRLNAEGVPVFIAAGNHDVPLSHGRATSVDIFGALQVRNVTVARQIGVHRIETRSGPVQVVAFPWAVRSLIAARPEYKNLTIAEQNLALIDLTRDKLRQEASGLDPSIPSVVVAHTHVFGARIGAERLLTMGVDPMYDLNTFDLPQVDYVGLGHIHKHQALAGEERPVVYPGSLERVDFGEEGEEKGWVLVDVPEKRKAQWEFRPVRARRFLTIEAKVESDNATEDVIRAITRQANKVADAVVKVRVQIPPERLGELREDDVRASLKEAFLVAPIERVVVQRIRERWAGVDAGIQNAPPLEALSLYLELQSVEPSRREVLLRYAEHLVEGHETTAAAPSAA